MNLKCTKHPKYLGKGKPQNECLTCLDIYFNMQGPRAPIKPTKIIKDKSKYSRKDKYKKEYL